MCEDIQVLYGVSIDADIDTRWVVAWYQALLGHLQYSDFHVGVGHLSLSNFLSNENSFIAQVGSKKPSGVQSDPEWAFPRRTPLANRLRAKSASDFALRRYYLFGFAATGRDRNFTRRSSGYV
jgi:hypothetical protein